MFHLLRLKHVPTSRMFRPIRQSSVQHRSHSSPVPVPHCTIKYIKRIRLWCVHTIMAANVTVHPMRIDRRVMQVCRTLATVAVRRAAETIILASMDPPNLVRPASGMHRSILCAKMLKTFGSSRSERDAMNHARDTKCRGMGRVWKMSNSLFNSWPCDRKPARVPTAVWVPDRKVRSQYVVSVDIHHWRQSTQMWPTPMSECDASLNLIFCWRKESNWKSESF